jgi:hypothetical protein
MTTKRESFLTARSLVLPILHARALPHLLKQSRIAEVLTESGLGSFNQAHTGAKRLRACRSMNFMDFLYLPTARMAILTKRRYRLRRFLVPPQFISAAENCNTFFFGK